METIENLEKKGFSSDSQANSFSGFLPWKAYDEQSGIFVGRNSLGFALEAIPMVKSFQAFQNELFTLFKEVIEEGESIQCLLWADPMISPFLDRWDNSRKRSCEVYRLVSQRRSHFLQLSNQLSPRIFRFILSYSIQSSHLSNLEKVKQKKQTILKTLKSLSYSYCWDMEDFIERIGSLIPFVAVKATPRKEEELYRTISSPLSVGASFDVQERCLKWTMDTSIYLKTFRVMDSPDHGSFSRLQGLIGDVFQFEAPFYLHYGMHCPHFPPRSMLTNEKFLWTQLSAGIGGKKENLNRAEKSLKHLFCLNRFDIAENHSLHLLSYLSALPMSWGEYAQDLKKADLLKLSLPSECGFFVPLEEREYALYNAALSNEGVICDADGNYSSLKSIV
ncbi:MAG: TraC family protein [Chlamydiales bacterium]